MKDLSHVRETLGLSSTPKQTKKEEKTHRGSNAVVLDIICSIM